jgi:hypothetical protein
LKYAIAIALLINLGATAQKGPAQAPSTTTVPSAQEAPVLDENLRLRMDLDSAKLVAIRSQAEMQISEIRSRANASGAEYSYELSQLEEQVERRYPGYKYQFNEHKGSLVKKTSSTPNELAPGMQPTPEPGANSVVAPR